jgi:hypothetical protein
MSNLIDAYNDCLQCLQEGESLEACLQKYPALADTLRPMLEIRGMVLRSAPDPTEIARAQTRVQKKILETQQSTTKFSLGRSGLAVAALLLMFVVGALAYRNSHDVGSAQTRTASPVLYSQTPSQTSTRAATQTFTATQILTATWTLTVTQTLTAVQTQTQSRSVTPFAGQSTLANGPINPPPTHAAPTRLPIPPDHGSPTPPPPPPGHGAPSQPPGHMPPPPNGP